MRPGPGPCGTGDMGPRCQCHSPPAPPASTGRDPAPHVALWREGRSTPPARPLRPSVVCAIGGSVWSRVLPPGAAAKGINPLVLPGVGAAWTAQGRGGFSATRVLTGVPFLFQQNSCHGNPSAGTVWWEQPLSWQC